MWILIGLNHILGSFPPNQTALMPQTILVVDDEADIRELLEFNLQKEGFRVVTASNGKQAIAQSARGVDLCLLDIMMPEMDGWDVSRALRSNPKTASIPIVFLTARDGEVDEVLGLELGAADYIKKPVRIRTVVARIRRLLRQPIEVPASESETITTGALKINAANYTIIIGKNEIEFPRKEFEILLFLARHPARVVKRETLLNEIWGRDVYVVDRTIDVHIRKIREKLGKYASYISTVKGVGYRFDPEV
jgi:two-component system alkaline phosphatase synthesis response regulator PhoP